MKVPRRSPRGRTIAFTAVFALIAMVVVGTFAESQEKQTLTARNDEKDPRNNNKAGLGEKYGSNPANDCWMHHKGEGMRDTVILYPILPQQFKVGQREIVPVQIVNPWKQELRDMSLEVSLKGETQILAVEGQAANAAAAVDIRGAREVCLGPSDPPTGTTVPRPGQFCPKLVSIPIDIPVGARALIARIEFYPGAGATTEQYAAGFRMDKASFWNPKDPADNSTAGKQNLTRNLVVTLGGGGRGLIEFLHDGGNALSTRVFVNWTIVMGGGAASSTRAYTIPIPFENLLKNTAGIVEVPITPFATGTQEMEFTIRSQLYYKHQDPSTPNEDYFTRYATLDEDEDLIRGKTITPMRHAVVGTTYIASPYGASSTPEINEDWRFVMAEISGFAAAGLLVPSLLLGGTYGKASRRFFNNLLGGAKRRVMYHNIMSLGLSLVALVHILLFMLEIRYTILMGVMWGGLGALSLLMLGLTGYYQVPLIQRHGYKWWRFTHLAFGLLVVVFVTYHAIADGPDFFFIKEQLPKWINDVNLAQK